MLWPAADAADRGRVTERDAALTVRQQPAMVRPCREHRQLRLAVRQQAYLSAARGRDAAASSTMNRSRNGLKRGSENAEC